MVLWCEFLSGWISGMAGLIVGHPIDTIKVRQQLAPGSILDIVKYLNKQGTGVLTFFRGMGAPLITNGVMNSVYFGFYGGTLTYLIKLEDDSKAYVHKHDAQLSHHFIAGCVGGLAQLVISCPVDFVKVQLQSRIQKNVVKGPVDCVLQTIKTHGPLGLYKGVVTQFWRDIPSSGLYFVMYEFFKRSLSKGRGHEVPSQGTQFISGGIAGMISWWSILPLDVIKSRVQGDSPNSPKYSGMINCAKIVYKEAGMRGFFRGFLPLSIRAFPVNGTTFLVYEYLFQQCRDHHINVVALL